MFRRLLRSWDSRTAPPARPSPRRRLLRWTGWLCGANTLVLILISLRNLSVVDLPNDWLPGLFAGTMFGGHCALLACLPALLLLPLILLWPRRAVVLAVGTLLSVLLIFTLLIDTVIFQQYRYHLNAEILNLLLGGAADEILAFSTRMYAQAALLMLAVVVGELLLGRTLWYRVCATRGGRLGYLAAATLGLAFLVQGGIHAWADVVGYIPVTRQSRVLLGYIPITAEQFLARLGVDVEHPASALRTRDHGSNLRYPLRPLACEAPTERPNLLFIVIDGWRFDALNTAVTPHVSRLAERGWRFTNHVSGGSATRTGIFALFYAIPGTYWHAMLAEQQGPVLLSELLRQDYEVSIFASAKLFNPEFDRTVFAEVAGLRLRSDGDGAAERDEDSTQDFFSFLDHRSPARPFFSLLFYDAPHAYDLPDDAPRPFQPSWDEVNYLALNKGFDPVPFHNRYLNCVHYSDQLVGRVLAELERRGLMENTVIAITGDHGQEFNDLGLNYWGHDSNFSRYQVAVPLVVYWPGRKPASYGHRTSHYDLAPTLMDELLGCTNDYADYSVGHHLLAPGRRDFLLLANYTDYAIVGSDRIVAVYPYGVEVLDLRYRPIPDALLDKAVMLNALDLRGRFYR